MSVTIMRKIASPNKLRIALIERKEKITEKHNKQRAKINAQLELNKKDFLNDEILNLLLDAKKLRASSDPLKESKLRAIDALIQIEQSKYKQQQIHSNFQKDMIKQKKINDRYRLAFKLAADPKTRKTMQKFLTAIEKEKKKNK